MTGYQSWMKKAPQLLLEWKQANDEGREVAAYEALCRTISTISEKALEEDWEKEAQAIAEKLQNAPIRSDYSYEEPSAYEEIVASLPPVRHSFCESNLPENFTDKLTGAWTGRIAGCLLGKPVEGYHRERLHALLKGTHNFPLKKYISSDDFTPELIKELELFPDACWANRVQNCAPIDDDTNYTVLALKLTETFGKKFTPNQVLEAWLLWLPMLATYTAERSAYRNAGMGLLAPETAVYHNPYREWIGAQIRADFYGYIHPGSPRKAAEMAWRDASISHVKNGIYGAMFVAGMLAAAAQTGDILTVIEAGLDEIPANCRLRKEIENVIAWHDEGKSADTVMDTIHMLYDEKDQHGWCHTIPNAMIVVTSLLYGNGSFGHSICLAVQAAFDTDCNGATVGSIIGMMFGTEAIDPQWTEPFHGMLATSIDGCFTISVDEFVKRTLSLMKA